MHPSPLFWAIEFSPRTAGEKSEVRKIMDMLIDAGADVNAQDQFGNTPLMYAAFKGNNQLIDILLHAGADINATREASGFTALACAVVMEHPETVRVLIEAGADLETTDKSGNTPLMKAKSKDSKHSEEIAKLLIDAGATR
jgi:ankyrin repeat protein